jgi:hypothetical protein
MSQEGTCPNCGAALMPADVFCGECGARVQVPDYDDAPDASLDSVIPVATEEPLREDEAGAAPTIAQYVSPPPIGEKASDKPNAWRAVLIVAAIGLLLVSLCLCSFGGLMLIPDETYPTVQDNLPFAVTLCFAPGVIAGLLAAGAAYFGFRKR